MIKIGSADGTNKREFTSEESQEVLPVWQNLSRKASERSLSLVSCYGKIDKHDPEWEFLAKRIDDCIQDWAEQIRRLGGEPRALWTVVWTEEGKQRLWQLEPSDYTGTHGTT